MPTQQAQGGNATKTGGKTWKKHGENHGTSWKMMENDGSVWTIMENYGKTKVLNKILS